MLSSFFSLLIGSVKLQVTFVTGPINPYSWGSVDIILNSTSGDVFAFLMKTESPLFTGRFYISFLK
jgi:hypothetical protein